MILHCLFEQSGTFKNEAIKLGLRSYDYDIKDDYHQTDFRTDLFDAINQGYVGNKSIFDLIRKDDYVIAFFPCVRFEKLAYWHITGQAKQQKNWTLAQKLKYSIGFHSQIDDMYILISKLVLIALKRGFKLIIENPYSSDHYLTRYWPLQPSIIEKDRSMFGDWYQKPTQYFFINCEPCINFVFEDNVCHRKKKVIEQSQVEKSLISPEYANRFIREHILKGVQNEI